MLSGVVRRYKVVRLLVRTQRGLRIMQVGYFGGGLEVDKPLREQMCICSQQVKVDKARDLAYFIFHA